jgi:hypothetical protein
MSRSRTVSAARRSAAAAAFRALGTSPSEHLLLAVHCARSHHVAALYSTPTGVVYVAVLQARSHGDRDRPDVAHRGGHGEQPWVDWIAPGDGVAPEDPLPAGCECGPRSLSRTRLLQAVESGEHRLVID